MQKVAESNQQEMKIIIPLSLILHYFHYFHPKKNVVNTQGYVWLHMLHICQKYTSIITFMARSLFKKTQGSHPKRSRHKFWRKIKSAYMKHIKIKSCYIVVIFTPKHMTCQRQQYMNTNSQIMRCHTGNVYCDVVPNVQALIFLTRKQMSSIMAPFLQFVFIFIILFHVVQNMASFH